MSFSNPTVKSPVTRYFQWNGGEKAGGTISHYDKDAKENIIVEYPFTFIVLDELNAITGFSDADHGGFWSNEVRNMKNDELVVRTKSGVKARGYYENIKDSIKSLGAKYAKSIYIAYKDDSGEFAIGNLKVAGAALTAWIEFNKQYDTQKYAAVLTGSTQAKKGATVYFVPDFTGMTISGDTATNASRLDKVLQRYLDISLARRDSEPVDEEDIDDVDNVDEADSAPEEEETKLDLAEIPFDDPKTETETKVEPKDTGIKDVQF
jgi:hypothetical protein